MAWDTFFEARQAQVLDRQDELFDLVRCGISETHGGGKGEKERKLFNDHEQINILETALKVMLYGEPKRARPTSAGSAEAVHLLGTRAQMEM